MKPGNVPFNAIGISTTSLYFRSMISFPSQFIASLQDVDGFDAAAFEAVHASGEQVTSIRINPLKISGPQPLFGPATPATTPVPWCCYGYYLDERPSFTFDPLFHAGCYYVQEASSMFLHQALQQTIDLSQPLKVLDLCAAPGGKSTLLQSLVSKDSLLVSNEVIKTRAGILAENITKWGAGNVVVTNNDPKDFARLNNYFDVIVIDAPCSGSGLFRRDPQAMEEWSEANVELCNQRQRRIIADVYPALKENGVLIYSTCSYSKAEDEDVMDWMLETLDAASLQLNVPATWNIVVSRTGKYAHGYRFYPDKVKGEGFFIACFKKTGATGGEVAYPKKLKTEKPTKNELGLLQPWFSAHETLAFLKWNDQLLAVPASLEKEIALLQQYLYLRQAGINAGQFTARELIPTHALALSTLVSSEVPRVELSLEHALQYLRKGDLQLPALSAKGWTLMQYKQQQLGWIKALTNRINNYYPAAWRILKDA